MSKSNPTQGLAGRADRLAKAVWVNLQSQKTPDHLIELVDELETARRTGRLRKSDRAA